MAISFMAKFNEREGSSCHIHFSLADEPPASLFARDQRRVRVASWPGSWPACAS